MHRNRQRENREEAVIDCFYEDKENYNFKAYEKM